ncbi:hypothetical protein D9M72_377850 [compost metagenome]
MRALVNRAHGLHDLPDHLIAPGRNLRRVRGRGTGLARALRVAAYGCRQLLHARRGLLERRGLLLRAGRQVEVARRDLPGCRADGLGAIEHRADRADQRLLHAMQAPHHHAHLVIGAGIDAALQVAASDVLELDDGRMNRAHDGTVRQPERDGEDHHRQCQQPVDGLPQPFRALARGLHFVRRARVEHGKELVHRLHDPGLVDVVVAVMHELARQFEIGRTGHGEAALAVVEPALHRVHRDHLGPYQVIRIALGVLKLRHLAIGEPGALHQIRQRHGLAVRTRRLVRRRDEIPVDALIVLRARPLSVADIQDGEVLGLVARVSGHDVRPGKTGQVIGTLAQLDRQLVGKVAVQVRAIQLLTAVIKGQNYTHDAGHEGADDEC